MTITCYSNFSKKNNSTKQPTGSGTDFTCTLKEPTSIINPIFILATGHDTLNDIKWGSRDYFVNDVIFTHNNYTEHHCTIDPMATWKTNIGAMSEYVLRAASASDGSVLDMMYPVKAGPSTDVTAMSTLHNSFVSSPGFYVVGVVGSVPSGSNAIQYYAMDRSTFRSFINYLFSTTWLDLSQQDITIDTQKQLLNPAQYIASCHWYPMPFPDAGMGSTETINFGWWTSNVTALLLSDREIIYQQAQTNLPSHPDIARGSYLNGSKYTKRALSIYNYGTFDLPSDVMINSPNILLDISVDLFAGSSILSVICNGLRIAQLTAEVGCEVPLAQISSGIFGTFAKTAADAASGLGEIITTKFESAVMGVYSAIGNAIAAKSTHVNILGGQGSNGVYGYIPRVESIFFRPVNDDPTQLGKPLCQVKTINTLSGYILCSNVEVDIPATEQEREAIAGYMTSGFFYE